jgi:hypothetical protein
MLIHYSVKNFQSFFDTVNVDWSQNAHVPESDWLTTLGSGTRVAKVMSVLGHNASGKTALLKALVFLDWFRSSSFQDIPPDARIPVTPHFLNIDQPTEFEALVEVDGQLWRYELSCNRDRVLHEALYKKRERFGYVFIRDWDDGEKKYKVKQQDFGFSTSKAEIACNQRQNASLISIAAQHGIPLAVELAESAMFSNIISSGRVHLSVGEVFSAAEDFVNNADLSVWMKNLLRSWDLGLNDIEFKETSFEQKDGVTIKRWIPFGVHTIHEKKYSLPLLEESSGTQGAFVLLSRLLQALMIGGIAIIDEFESDLHPHMLEPILDLFANPKTNPHNAQMLFTCHAAEILNLLPKSQVILVEKNDCESEAWRLDEVEGIRSDDNFYAKYMSGAYGAVPEL